MAYKILIIENIPEEFKLMQNKITEVFGEQVEVFPKLGKTPSIEYQTYFIQKFAQLPDKFPGIIEYYDDIDLFILDIALIDNADEIGLYFKAFLKENYKHPYEVIVVSSSSNSSDVLAKTGAAFPYYLVEKIKELSGTLSYVTNSPVPDTPIQKTFKERWRERFQLGTFFGWIKTGNNADLLVRRLINAAILLVFYCLIIAAVKYAAVHLYEEIWHSPEVAVTKNIKTEPNAAADSVRIVSPIRVNGAGAEEVVSRDTVKALSINNTKAKDAAEIEDTKILQVAEKIFLYLLPVFIVFGFFNYYKTNTSIYLLGGNSHKIEEEKSTKAMDVTKMIFLSSLISYLLIKLIDEIFLKECNRNILIPGGILLVLLMIYFLLLTKKHTAKER